MKKSEILLKIESKLVGEMQPTSRELINTGLDPARAEKLAILRILTASTVAIDAAATFLKIWGFSDKSPSYTLWFLGMALNLVSFLTFRKVTNKAGALIRTHFDALISSINKQPKLTAELLLNAGLSQTEIQSLHNLGIQAYVAEYSVNPRAAVKNASISIAASAALLTSGLPVEAGILGALAYYFTWEGQRVYRESFSRADHFNLAKSAQQEEQILELNREHSQMVQVLGLKEKLPYLLLAMPIISGNYASTIPTFFAINSGLPGATDMLSSERSQVSAKTMRRTFEALHAVYDTMITDQFSWDRFRSDSANSHESSISGNNSEVVISNLKSQLPNGEMSSNLVDVALKQGEITELRGTSGGGKTVLFYALAGLLKHEGEIYLKNNGELTSIKDIEDYEERQRRIYFPDLHIKTSKRIVDSFTEIFLAAHPNWNEWAVQSIQHKTLVYGDDNLLERILDANSGSGKLKRYSNVSNEEILTFRQERLDWVNHQLQASGGNIARGVRALNAASNLSDGERKRFGLLLGFLASKYLGVQLLLLDEPFSNLDSEHVLSNSDLQKTMLDEIQFLPESPAIITITHGERESQSVVDIDVEQKDFWRERSIHDFFDASIILARQSIFSKFIPEYADFVSANTMYKSMIDFSQVIPEKWQLLPIEKTTLERKINHAIESSKKLWREWALFIKKRVDEKEIYKIFASDFFQKLDESEQMLLKQYVAAIDSNDD